ncbi:LPS export ABC transporter permease LptF [Litorisediminicola beolgyonensis]|uniref:LPS export ABC transporter permease LptF n=1 Tax=Litorisediminicola beolgyonensis TaxID=1173614 RepID=A0ABW3ZJT9_9RHOB
MARFDRYLLSRLLVLFGFFTLVLVAVYWINRAVVLFDRLIADGQSAGVVLEFTLLSLPGVILSVLPMSAFAAAVAVTNRLSSDSELTVMRATGFSPWRLARPVLFFGLFVGCMMLVLSNVLVPSSLAQLRDRELEVSGAVSARLLREGSFLHPSRGVTFYIRDITAEGELLDVYLSDRRQDGREVTYTAESAVILRDDDETRLILLNGLAQTYEIGTRRLSTTTFADLTYDVSALIDARDSRRPEPDELPTLLLLTDPEGVSELTREDIGEVFEEAHTRLAMPILAVVASLVGFAALIVGGFSRFGLGKQIAFAVLLLVLIKMVESAATAAVLKTASLWPLTYAAPLFGLVLVATMLAWAARPHPPRRRLREAEEAAT